MQENILNDDMLKKIIGNLKPPEIDTSAIHFRQDPFIQEALRNMAREKAEKREREKEQVELLWNLLDIAKENPTAVQQHIETLVQNSGTIQNMQTSVCELCHPGEMDDKKQTQLFYFLHGSLIILQECT